MIGDGVLLQFNGTFTDVRLCLDLGAFSQMYAVFFLFLFFSFL